ncbi:kinase [Streptomyces ziwulingensis]|uniref:Kinase n=1 Tax=Streptomyces ziwulingensis TaxID=1045501 RepID=A0ABP9CI31_9ACTN
MRTHESATESALDGGLGISRAFGTFGELLQGVLPGGDLDFLVTLPIDLWSTARFEAASAGDPLLVRPARKRKSLTLARALLAMHGIDRGGTLTLHSALPEGKGLASSSADLVASCRAICAAFHLPLTDRTIEDLLRAIEPSDGVMYTGSVAFYHRRAKLRERLGHLPPLTIVGIDEGGAVPTVAFNRIPKPFGPADKHEYARLLDTLARAVRDRDLATVGEVATRSAVMNQRLRPKRTLDEMRRICRAAGGLGVVSAHSGTVLGVLLAEDDPEYENKLEHLRRSCGALTRHTTVYHSLTDDAWYAPPLTDRSGDM